MVGGWVQGGPSFLTSDRRHVTRSECQHPIHDTVSGAAKYPVGFIQEEKTFCLGMYAFILYKLIDTKPSGLRGGLTHRCMPRPSPMLAPSKVMFHVVMHAGMLVLCFSLQGSA